MPFRWRIKREWRAACTSARTRQLPEPEPDCDSEVAFTRKAFSNDACPACDGCGTNPTGSPLALAEIQSRDPSVKSA